MAELITVARPYAEAVFRLGKESGKLDQWSEVLAKLGLIADDATARQVASNPRYSAAQVQQLLVELLGAGVTDEVKNFVALILENDRFTALPVIRDLYESYKAAEAGEVEAQIESAFPLDAAQVDALKTSLAQHFNRKVAATTSTNADLIGGVKVTVGDVVIDASIAGKLSELATSLKS
ncbi:F-type H+-transporting ATPase subunit delta [Silvimonas terrae]|uniref:ATP synthase subunit delta n=1 Tax=Silvimonas terrae TaxID=300266 RepID=A0A840RHG4_9NEIS|nr:F0F1 ATP synthase subunit delta [Silvimonas terrae]MBB5192014.1 F-type H+-transporting ATPase subunit delta [Silvimonas terrae]